MKSQLLSGVGVTRDGVEVDVGLAAEVGSGSDCGGGLEHAAALSTSRHPASMDGYLKSRELISSVKQVMPILRLSLDTRHRRFPAHAYS